MGLMMKANFSEKQFLPFALLKQESLSGVAALVKDIVTKSRGDGAEKDKLSYWQLVFLQSKANGCSYRGDGLPQVKWRWPRDTWFQEQMAHRLKVLESAVHPMRN
jgi:hypothetical protein